MNRLFTTALVASLVVSYFSRRFPNLPGARI